MEEIVIPDSPVEWLWQGMKDSEGVIGRHRVGVRYQNNELEKRRMKRIARESEGRTNGVKTIETVEVEGGP